MAPTRKPNYSKKASKGSQPASPPDNGPTSTTIMQTKSGSVYKANGNKSTNGVHKSTSKGTRVDPLQVSSGDALAQALVDQVQVPSVTQLREGSIGVLNKDTAKQKVMMAKANENEYGTSHKENPRSTESKSSQAPTSGPQTVGKKKIPKARRPFTGKTQADADSAVEHPDPDESTKDRTDRSSERAKSTAKGLEGKGKERLTDRESVSDAERHDDGAGTMPMTTATKGKHTKGKKTPAVDQKDVNTGMDNTIAAGPALGTASATDTTAKRAPRGRDQLDQGNPLTAVFMKATQARLKFTCETYNLVKGGNKAELVKRLIDAGIAELAEVPKTDDTDGAGPSAPAPAKKPKSKGKQGGSEPGAADMSASATSTISNDLAANEGARSKKRARTNDGVEPVNAANGNDPVSAADLVTHATGSAAEKDANSHPKNLGTDVISSRGKRRKLNSGDNRINKQGRIPSINYSADRQQTINASQQGPESPGNVRAPASVEDSDRKSTRSDEYISQKSIEQDDNEGTLGTLTSTAPDDAYIDEDHGQLSTIEEVTETDYEMSAAPVQCADEQQQGNSTNEEGELSNVAAVPNGVDVGPETEAITVNGTSNDQAPQDPGNLGSLSSSNEDPDKDGPNHEDFSNGENGGSKISSEGRFSGEGKANLNQDLPAGQLPLPPVFVPAQFGILEAANLEIYYEECVRAAIDVPGRARKGIYLTNMERSLLREQNRKQLGRLQTELEEFSERMCTLRNPYIMPFLHDRVSDLWNEVVDVKSKLRAKEIDMTRRRQRKIRHRLAQARREWSVAVADAQRREIFDPLPAGDPEEDPWVRYPWFKRPGMDWAKKCFPKFDWENANHAPWLPEDLWEQQAGAAPVGFAYMDGIEPQEFIPPMDVQELWAKIHCVKLNIDAYRRRLRRMGLPNAQEVVKEHLVGRSVKGDEERRILAQLKMQFSKTRKLLETELLRWRIQPSRLAGLADKVGNLFARLYGCHTCVDEDVDFASEFGGFQTKGPGTGGENADEKDERMKHVGQGVDDDPEDTDEDDDEDDKVRAARMEEIDRLFSEPLLPDPDDELL